MSARFTRAEFLAWLALLEAALEQPQPTPALKRAIAAVERTTEPEPRPKRAAARGGWHLSPETRAKISAAMRRLRAEQTA